LRGWRKEDTVEYETPQIEIVASAGELIQFKPSGRDDLSGSGKSKQQQVSAVLEADE